jgi:hypothetical protein
VIGAANFLAVSLAVPDHCGHSDAHRHVTIKICKRGPRPVGRFLLGVCPITFLADL